MRWITVQHLCLGLHHGPAATRVNTLTWPSWQLLQGLPHINNKDPQTLGFTLPRVLRWINHMRHSGLPREVTRQAPAATQGAILRPITSN